jgi:uncharacterized protein (TIGR00369 family)
MAEEFDINLEVAERFALSIPHVRELGIEAVEATAGEGVMKLPYREDLIGNPDTGVLHGGVITTLIDTVCGFAVFCGLGEIRTIATLDLRIDYLKPATPGLDLYAYAHCYKSTRNIAFARAVAYHVDRDDPIAHTAATFMIGTAGPTFVPGRKDGTS